MPADPSANTVEMLYVDDERRPLLSDRRLVERFRSLNCSLEVTPENSADRACGLIEQRPRPYDVVLTDLIFVETPDPEAPQDAFGLDVIRQARASSTKTVVVALTGLLHKYPRLQTDAFENGADRFYSMEQLLEVNGLGGLDTMVREIYDDLCNRGLIEPGPQLVYSENEPGVEAIVEEVGPVALRLLLDEILGADGARPLTARVEYLTPGASGAHVVSVTTEWPAGATRRYFVKVGRNRDALTRELAKAGTAAAFYNTTLVVPHVHAVQPFGDRNGWWAIAMRHAHNAVTLRQWLQDPDAAAHVPMVLNRLFLEGGLAIGYRNPTLAPGRRPADPLILNPLRRARVRIAVGDIRPALHHPDAAAMSDDDEAVRAIERFARAGLLLDGRDARQVGGDAYDVYGHGDLHCGNILVTLGESPMPLMVDLSEFDRYHWASDVARLVVDLVLRSVDAGVGSMTWRNFPQWRKLVAAFARFEPLGDLIGDGNEAALGVLTWMINNRGELLPLASDRAHIWEWHLALAQQWLRCMSHEFVQPPKRALAVAAAYDQLRAATAAAPPTPETF